MVVIRLNPIFLIPLPLSLVTEGTSTANLSTLECEEV